MFQRTISRLKARRGISLLEMMIVLAIIALIAGLAAPRLLGSFGRAKANAAEIQMTHLRGALQLMYVDLGRYPTEEEGLGALLTAPQGAQRWQGPYLEGAGGLTDPWGHPYIFRTPGSERAYDILSLGRDGVEGGDGEDADIVLK